MQSLDLKSGGTVSEDMLIKSPDILATSYILSFVVITFFVMDNFLLLFIKFKKISFDNIYLKLHLKYGYIKLTILKLFCLIYIIYGLFHVTGKSGLFVMAIIAYIVYVLLLLKDVLARDNNIKIH